VRETALEGARVTLRPLRAADTAALSAILRDRQVGRFLPPQVRGRGAAWIARALATQRHQAGIAFVILPRGSPEVVGQVRLFGWSRAERRAELGYWLRRAQRGRGYGTDAARLLCRHGFRTMGLHRIEATVVTGNDRSRRVLQKVGFRLEGVRRRAARLSDRWADEWTLGLLEDELR
jgi:RimJ/RimL family protein N-acetyltransferase